MVAWLIVDAGGVIFPNYARHNGDCARKRALDAERAREYRARTRAGRLRHE